MRASPAALERIMDAIGGDPDILADIVRSFIEEAAHLVPALRRTAADMDLQSVSRIAHTIKASARDFGDEDLATFCASLENDGKAGHVDALSARVERISALTEALCTDLARTIEQSA